MNVSTPHLLQQIKTLCWCLDRKHSVFLSSYMWVPWLVSIAIPLCWGAWHSRLVSNLVTHGCNSSQCPLAIQTPYRLSCITKLTELSDWILDALWLEFKDPSCYRVAFVTAHNALLVCSMDGSSLSTATYQNEVNCILYPTILFSWKFGVWQLAWQLPPNFNCVCMYVYTVYGDARTGLNTNMHFFVSNKPPNLAIAPAACILYNY